LQNEAQEYFHTENSPKDVNKLLLLDSFIKESIRCSNSDASKLRHMVEKKKRPCIIKRIVPAYNGTLVTCRRKALISYTFHDGSFISKGDWVCVPQRAMMQDCTRYKDPQTFDGFRFVRANDQLRQRKQCSDVPDKKESNLTDASPDWLIWGFGSTAW
jgi:hypothetical protein